jgi:nicotinate-nucleotide pyrophosphorylase (carboxylating)
LTGVTLASGKTTSAVYCCTRCFIVTILIFPAKQIPLSSFQLFFCNSNLNGNTPMLKGLIRHNLRNDVARALEEDVGSGDITAMLIPPDRQAEARVITREPAVICGQAWVNEVFRQVDANCKLEWLLADGDTAKADAVIFRARGPARALLTAERCALNFLQTLSATATTARHYAQMVAHTRCRILDTRKTLPGLRYAQKYAVACGGCSNHRLGLWDAFLIKENHIAACGSIPAAIAAAHAIAPGKTVEIEVEHLAQLQIAIEAGADIVMLDNFSLQDMQEAVRMTAGRVKLEASGGIDDQTLVTVAETGVDYISIGGLTKHCRAIDLSMRLVESQ